MAAAGVRAHTVYWWRVLPICFPGAKAISGIPGKVMSDRSIQVKYAGRLLQSEERCWWTVQVWDESGRQGIGVPVSAWWEMGLLEQDDWGDAGWITAPVSEYRYPYEDTTTESGLNDKVEPAPMFRTTYAITGEVRPGAGVHFRLGVLRIPGER